MTFGFLRVKPLPAPPPSPAGELTGRDVSLWAYTGSVRARWTAGLLVAITSALIAISIPQVLSWIVDELLTDRPTEAAVWAGGALVLGLGLAQSLLFLARRQLMVEPASTVENTMRMGLFDRLLRAPVSFHERWPSGQLLTRSMSDLSTVRRWTAFGLVQLITTAVQVAVGLVYMARGSWQLALLYLLSLPVTLFFIWRFVRTFRSLTREAQEKTGDLATTVEQSVLGIRVLKALGRGQDALATFTADSARLRDLEVDRGRALALMRMQTTLTGGLTLALALWVGLHLVAAASMSLGDLTGFFATAAILTAQVERSGMLLSMYLAARVSLDRHRQVMTGSAGERVPLEAGQLESGGRGAAGLLFDRVDFSYDRAGAPVLHELSLEVKPGEIIALVGATGSGKSTLLQLLAGLYRPQGGRILLDGEDLAQLSLSHLRSRVSIAFEEPYLFSASVQQNILLGLDEDSLEPGRAGQRVARALEVAAADFVADLPEGVDTQIGEEGMSLSGGQRQRLSLARAIAARPSLLLLDDPLSALDVSTEQRVVANLREELAKTTVLLSAHRSSTLALADRVVLLEQGRVAAVCSHRELLENRTYRRLMALGERKGQHGDQGPKEGEEL